MANRFLIALVVSAILCFVPAVSAAAAAPRIPGDFAVVAALDRIGFSPQDGRLDIPRIGPATGGPGGTAAPLAERNRSFVPGELIVKLKQGPSSGAYVAGEYRGGYGSLDDLNARFGVTGFSGILHPREKRGRQGLLGGKRVEAGGDGLARVYKVVFDPSLDMGMVLEAYRSNPLVEYAEPNMLYEIFVTPDDTYFDQQWALNQPSDNDIDAPEAWDTEKGDSGVIIAIIDTGVDWGHPDLSGKIWNNTDEIAGNGIDDDSNGFIDDVRGYDFVNVSYACYPGEDCAGEDNDPADFHGHGTHCSGIAAASTDNGAGVAGICWNCRIMPVRAGFKASNGYGVLEEEDIAQAIYYAADNGADVMSMSFGGDDSNLIDDAVDYAYYRGAVMVASSGNSNDNSSVYPAAYPSVISVSATTNNDGKSSYSNYGYWVDVSAPGGEPSGSTAVSIVSTLPGGAYGTMAGTSMACPHVAGEAGLILSEHPSFSPDEVKKAIKSAVDPVSSEKYMGFGRINVRDAIGIGSVPDSNISSPSMGGIVSGSVIISGTANGTDFENYTVYDGTGLYPSTWTEIGSAYSPVAGGQLMAWDTLGSLDGYHVLKLVVRDTNGFSIDRKLVRVLNNASSCTSCEDCTFKVQNQSVSYMTLGANMSGNDTCLTIERDDIVFDCMGRTIAGSGAGYGILAEGASGVSIRNCTIEGFQAGILLDGSRQANLTLNSINGSRSGIRIEGASMDDYNHSIGQDNRVGGWPVNYYFGITGQVISLPGISGHLEVAYSTNVNITDNQARGDGIMLTGVSGAVMKNNTVINATYSGISLVHSAGNNLTANTVNKTNETYGFRFEESLYNYADITNRINGEQLHYYFNVSGTPSSFYEPQAAVLDEPNATNLGAVTIVNSSFVRIRGFRISGGEYGIYAVGSLNAELSGNRLAGSLLGISLDDCDNSSAINNTVVGNLYSGIAAGSGSVNATVTNNTVSLTSLCLSSVDFFGLILELDTGGILMAGYNGTVAGNNVSYNNCSGISVFFSGNTISGNVLENNSGGFFVGGSGNNFTSNNVTKPDHEYGFRFFFELSDSPLENFINQSNVVNSEAVHHYYMAGNGASVINLTGLDLDQPNVTNLGKISVISSTGLAVDSSSLSGSDFGAFIYKSGNIILSNLSVRDSSIAGIYAMDASGVSVSRCNLTGAMDYGLLLYNLSGAVGIYENNILSGALYPTGAGDGPMELSSGGSGNFWGRTDPPYFVAGEDSSNASVTDSFPYGRASGWLDDTPPTLNLIEPSTGDGNWTNALFLYVNVSADENITACLLDYINGSLNYTMNVSRNNEFSYCYINLTGLGNGWHSYRVYANDSSYNWNSTQPLLSRINGPPAVSNSSIIPHVLLSGESVNVTAHASDQDNISSVLAVISNSSYSSSFMLSPQSGAYAASKAVLLGPGTYNLSLRVNDTLGAASETLADHFDVRLPSQVHVQISDHLGGPRNLSFRVYSPVDGFQRAYQQNVSSMQFQVPNGLWNLNFSQNYSIILSGTNLSYDFSGRIALDDVPPYLVVAPEQKQFSKVIAGDTNFTYSSADVVIHYSGIIGNEDRIVVYRCQDWNLTQRNCTGGAAGWGNKLVENTNYWVDRAANVLTINATGFSAYAAGEEILTCGNGVVDDQSEECDGGDLDGESCQTLGFSYGTLGCTANCLFNTGSCGRYSGGDGTPGTLTIQYAPASVNATSGRSVSFQATARNGWTSALTNVTVSASTNCSLCQTTVQPQAASIASGGNANFTVSVDVPASQAAGIYTLNLTVASSQGLGSTRLVQLRISSPVCVPGSRQCSLTGNVMACSADGTSWQLLNACPSGCANGSCAAICTAGQKRCLQGSLEICSGDGAGWDVDQVCEHGCSPDEAACLPAVAAGPLEGESRCLENVSQQYIAGRWVTIENCANGCAVGQCVQGGPPPFDAGFLPIIVIGVATVGALAGLGYYLGAVRMKAPDWESLESKWEVIATRTSSINGNPDVFMKKKVSLKGKITESIIYETGVIGSTLKDAGGTLLVFSNPPVPSGWVKIDGIVMRNDIGEIYLEATGIKKDIMSPVLALRDRLLG